MIDINKTYKTATGHNVTIFTTEGSGHWPVVGEFLDGNELVTTRWDEDGHCLSNSGDKLVEIVQREVWLNIYNNRIHAHLSESKAIERTALDLLARKCIAVEYAPGDTTG